MGLLDNITGASWDDPKTLGLLAAAAQMTQQRGMPGLLAGLQTYGGALAQAKDKERAIAQEALKQELLRAQIGEVKAQQQQRLAEAAKMQQQALRGQQFQQALGAAATTSPAAALAANGGPTNAAAAAVGQPRAVDWSAIAIQHPEQIDLIKKLAEARNFGADKVARTIEARDAQGRPVTMQLDDYGRPVGQGLPQWKAPVQADTGGQLQFIDPVTMGVMAAIRKTNTPDALLSAETARRGQNMVDARSRDANANTAAAAGKVEYKQDAAGNWFAFPKDFSGSGPVQPVPVQLPSKRDQQAASALDIIKIAEPLINQATGSYFGAGVDQAARVFGTATPGAKADAQLKALEGALMMSQPRMEGPQSDKDTALYRQMAAQIGNSTVPGEQKRVALQIIKRLHEQYAGKSGGVSGSWGPEPGTVEGGFRFKGGNPADRNNWELVR